MIMPLQGNMIKKLLSVYEPFYMIGRIIPSYQEGIWTFRELPYDEIKLKQYPPEAIDHKQYINNKDRIAFVYMEGDEILGLIRISKNWNNYCHIEDLSVRANFRGRGIGTQLMQEARKWAEQWGLKGFMLETQDTNVMACRFYQKHGFVIGAVDAYLYKALEPPYCYEKAIYWYLLFEE